MATAFFGGQASALTKATATETQKAQAFLDMRALQACVRIGTFSSSSPLDTFITPEDAAAGKWFNDLEVGVGGFESSTGNVKCSDTAWLKRAIAMFGWTDPKQALKDLGFKQVPPDNNFAPINGNNDFNNNNFEKVIEARWGGQLDPTPMGQYLIYRAAFLNICGASPTTDRDIASGTGGMILKLPQADGSTKEELFKLGMQKGDVVTISATQSGSAQLQISCEEIGQTMQNLGPQVLAAIKSGVALEAITPIATSGSGSPDSKENCNVAGVGWIVCPVALFIGKIADGTYSLVEQMLVFRIDNPFGNNPIFQVWSSVRNVANVAFIIALFVVIFSQATSVGLSNYGIKKMLPRIIVAAIMVNLSYYICLFAIDVSNILGAGIDGIIKSAIAGVGNSNVDFSWETVITNVLLIGAGAIVVGTATAAALLGAATIFGLAALSAIITALVILVGRQAILIILIALSPLAFVAYILPNTENLFDKWRKLFTTMIIFYPLVALLFSGSQLAAEVMRSGSGSNNGSELIRIFSLGVQAFPLFATPLLLKFSGGLLGRVAGMVNNPNKGPFDRMRKASEAKQDELRNRRQKAGAENRGNLFMRATRGRSVRKGIRRKELYRSAHEQAEEAQKMYAGKLLRPGEDGMPNDVKFAGRMAGMNRREIRDFKNLDRAHKDQKAIQEGLWAMQDQALGYGDNIEGTQARIDAARKAQSSYNSGRTVANASQSLGEANLNEAVKVMARGQAIVDDIEAKDLKAAQVMQSNVRMSGNNLKAVLDQAVGTTVQGMSGNSIIVTEAAKAAAGATLLGQAREVNTVLKSAANLNDKSLRSFLVGQIGSNFTAIKQKQVAFTDEAFQQQIINGMTPNQFEAQYQVSAMKRLAGMPPQIIVSQEPASIKAAESIYAQLKADPNSKLAADVVGNVDNAGNTLSASAMRNKVSKYLENIEGAMRLSLDNATTNNLITKDTRPSIEAMANRTPGSAGPIPSGSGPIPTPSGSGSGGSGPIPTPSGSGSGGSGPIPSGSGSGGTGPVPTPPISPRTDKALRRMFEAYSADDIRRMSPPIINMTINNVGGVSNLSNDDLQKLHSSLGEMGVRDTDQQILFQRLNDEIDTREVGPRGPDAS